MVRRTYFSIVPQSFPASSPLAVGRLDDSDGTVEDGGPELFRTPATTNLPAVDFATKSNARSDGQFSTGIATDDAVMFQGSSVD